MTSLLKLKVEPDEAQDQKPDLSQLEHLVSTPSPTDNANPTENTQSVAPIPKLRLLRHSSRIKSNLVPSIQSKNTKWRVSKERARRVSRKRRIHVVCPIPLSVKNKPDMPKLITKFNAAKEARQKAEELVKSGCLKLTSKDKSEGFKRPTIVVRKGCSKSKRVLFSPWDPSLESKSGHNDSISVDISSKSFGSCENVPREKKTVSGVVVTQADSKKSGSGVVVTASGITKSFLLNSFNMYGTITRLNIFAPDSGLVHFVSAEAADGACKDKQGSTLMKVRVATAFDYITIDNILGGRPSSTQVKNSRNAHLWSLVAAGQDKDLNFLDSRQMMIYDESPVFQ